MHLMDAKKKSLEDIMSLMDEQVFRKLKKKGQPAVVEVAIDADKPQDAAAPAAEEPGEDHDMLQKLADMYSKDDDSENC